MLAIPAAAVAYGVYRLIASYDENFQELSRAKEEVKRQMPKTGQYQAAHRVAQATGQARRVFEDTDLRGVPVWHVDYGNGSLHTLYHPPTSLHVPTFY